MGGKRIRAQAVGIQQRGRTHEWDDYVDSISEFVARGPTAPGSSA
jgi:hypothetical protein